MLKLTLDVATEDGQLRYSVFGNWLIIVENGIWSRHILAEADRIGCRQHRGSEDKNEWGLHVVKNVFMSLIKDVGWVGWVVMSLRSLTRLYISFQAPRAWQSEARCQNANAPLLRAITGLGITRNQQLQW